MHWTKVLFCLAFIGLLQEYSIAQSSSAFPSLWYPRSVASGGLGEQGVASRSVLEAMQYNPAGLVHAEGVIASIFRNPWQISGWIDGGLPLTSMKLAMKLSNCGSIGLEYTHWDLGEFQVSSPSGPEGETIQMYERSVAGGYAMCLSEQVAIGAEARYVWEPMPRQQTVNHLLFSAGLSYEPGIFSRRLNFGLSLVNFGTRIEYPRDTDPATGQPIGPIQADPPPAQMHIGIDVQAVANKFFDLDLAIGAMKPFDKRDDPPGYAGQSSFKSLFNDWDDFPEDMTGQIGLGFLWHPISLGGGISFIQEMYLGYFSTGPKDYPNSFYTHGVKIGLSARGMSLTAGYAGRWHNNMGNSYLTWKFPWETFQIDLSSDLSLFGMGEQEATPNGIPHGIILSGGYSYSLVIGKMKEVTSGDLKISFSGKTIWSIEADFYINENAAVLSSVAYARISEDFTLTWNPPRPPLALDFPIETVSLESGFRYHPIDAFHPFFVQASLGIIRMNPVVDSSPRYRYQAFDRLVVGSLFPIADLGIVVIPRIGMRTLLLPEYLNLDRLGGYNQFEFGANVGYRF